MQIGVIGGGIGGLTSALTLRQAGFEVTVFERSPRLLDQGAGVTLAPNATRVLYHLGLGDALEATAVTQPVSEYRHYRTGKVLQRIIRDDNRVRYGSPHLRMHRWDLQKALVDHLAGVAPGALRLGKQVTNLRRTASRVELQCADGEAESFDVVVGADGIHSRTRDILFAFLPPAEFTGFVAWRGLVATAGLPPTLLESVVSFGQGRHLNRYLVPRGELVNFVAVARRDAWEAEGWTIQADVDELLAEFAAFDADSRAILSRPMEGQLFKWGLFGRAPLQSWFRDGVVLLGDAAHPMLPFQGQGGAMAIEDAMILARALASSDTPDRAFAAYQATRFERVGQATARAASQGDKYKGEPDETSLNGNEGGDWFSYDAISTPLNTAAA